MWAALTRDDIAHLLPAYNETLLRPCTRGPGEDPYDPAACARFVGRRVRAPHRKKCTDCRAVFALGLDQFYYTETRPNGAWWATDKYCEGCMAVRLGGVSAWR